MLPNYTKDLVRVAFISLTKPKTFNPILMIQKLQNMIEFETHNNFCGEEIFIIDIKNFSLEDVLRLTPNLMIKSVKIGQVKNHQTAKNHHTHFFFFGFRWFILYALKVYIF